MHQREPNSFFDEKCAAGYDQQWAKLAPLRDTLHLLTGAVLLDLPAEARILCAGVGTGSELLYLAQRFPNWRFTALEPSAPMLEVCRRRTEEAGISARCAFHEGYVDSLPAGERFDAATSFLVSQFILDPEARAGFFRAIAERLRPGGYLVTADLASDADPAIYESLLEVWLRVMLAAEVPPETRERLRAAYARDVAVRPPEEVRSLLIRGGFPTPIQFLQTGLIHGWYAQRY